LIFKALKIRVSAQRGWPAVIKTFRTRRDATDWAGRTEDEMVRGVYIDRAASERLLLQKALDRYEAEVCATKRASTARREKPASANLKAKLRLNLNNLTDQDHCSGGGFGNRRGFQRGAP